MTAGPYETDQAVAHDTDVVVDLTGDDTVLEIDDLAYSDFQQLTGLSASTPAIDLESDSTSLVQQIEGELARYAAAEAHTRPPAAAPVTTGSADAADAVIDLTRPDRVVAYPPADIYRAKRIVDLVLLVAVAIPALLIGAVAAMAVKLTSPGPVLFKQERVGVSGELFECLKFRTMFVGDNPLVPDASRITSAGKWLRRFSIDELPQLWCVFRGSMSVVGPRPMLPLQAERCDGIQAGRFAVRPGLTGLAQINGRNSIQWAARMKFDLDYVKHQSAGLDLRIVLSTVQALLGGDGVDSHDAEDPFVAAL